MCRLGASENAVAVRLAQLPHGGVRTSMQAAVTRLGERTPTELSA